MKTEGCMVPVTMYTSGPRGGRKVSSSDYLAESTFEAFWLGALLSGKRKLLGITVGDRTHLSTIYVKHDVNE